MLTEMNALRTGWSDADSSAGSCIIDRVKSSNFIR